LSKASVLPRKAVKDAGPSGSLSETPLIDLINFCESNSLTGTLIITNDGREGVFTYSRGEVISIKMDDKSDDSALDEMLKWEDGKFEIKSKPLTLDAKKETESKDTKEILIVNNSLVVRKLIERAFRSLGYKVATAENVEKSKATIGQSIPDIVITDVKLSDGLGLDLCKTVREDKDIPFIFLADDSVKSEFSDELKSLGKAELTKTHEVSEIVKLVENML
jgi:CheY-like chemotaxis protein